MRAQITIETFLSIAIASILLVWFSNFAVVHGVETKRIAVFQQEKAIVEAIAAALNVSSTTNTKISLTLPCIYEGPNSVVLYNISIDENGVSIISPFINYTESASPKFSKEIVVLNCSMNCIVSEDDIRCSL